MGVESKGEVTRRRLLDAAAEDAAVHGLGGVSLNRVAKVVGLKTASVYFHFASREALLDAMLEEGLAETLRHFERELADAEPDPASRLRAAIRAHLLALHELRPYARVVLSGVGRQGDGPSGHRALLQRYLGEWSTIVADAQAAGLLGTRDEAAFVRDCLFGALNQTIRSGSAAGKSIEEMASLAYALFAGGRP